MADLRRLSTPEVITGFSYISDDGQTVYLEEDDDMGTFIASLQAQGLEYQWQKRFYNGDCFIRNLRPYSYKGES